MNWLLAFSSTNQQTFSSLDSLKKWIRQQHQKGAVFLLLVKPDAADVLDPLSEDLRREQIVFGFDLLPQDKIAINGTTAP